MNHRSFRIAAGLLAAILVATVWSCSTLSQKNQPINERKNEAAGYLALGDDFLAKNQYASALQFYDQALRTNLGVDYVEGAIAARSSLGRVYLRLQSWDDAAREMLDALLDARALNNPALLALCLNNLGEYHHMRGESAEADEHFRQAYALAESAKDEKLLAVVSHNLGVAEVRNQKPGEARVWFEKARAANEKASRWSEFAANCYMLASIENRENRVAEAIVWAEQALEADKKAENSIGIAADLEALGRLQRKAGKPDAAFDYFRRAFNLSLQLNDFTLAERSLDNLIELAGELGLADYQSRYTTLRQRLEAGGQ